MTTATDSTITLKWDKVHRDIDGGTEIATAFKDDSEPLLFFIRRCLGWVIDPKWREEVVEYYDGRQEVICDGWTVRKVSENGAKYLEFSFPCVINSPYDCTGQICRDEIFITLGANGLVIFMREYLYDV